MPIADRLFTNGLFHTLDPSRPDGPPADALASWRGRIVAVGSQAEVDALVGPHTEVVDLAGAAVLPGFIETHMHPIAAGVMMSAAQIGYPACHDIDGVVAALAARANMTPTGEPIQTWGYDDSLMDDDRHLTRDDLNRACTNHPILVRQVSGHLTYANDRALELAGIAEDVEDPVGGLFQRDGSGRLNGCMEETAGFAVSAALPTASLEDTAAAVKAISDLCLSVGTTTMTDAAVVTPTMYAAYQQGVEDGSLRVRTQVFPIWRTAGDLPFRTGIGDDRLSIGAMKFISDGSIQGYTACLCKGYHDRPDVHGYEVIPAAELTEMVVDAHAGGWQVAIHANGAAAIDNALDAIAAARLGGRAAVFANHIWYWGDRHRDRFLGPERGSRIDPLASFTAHGIVHALHCDMPVTPLDPLFTIWTAVNRITRDGELLGPDQRARVADAVAGYTSAAAFVSMEEHDKGTLEVGKLADLVVLDADPFEVDPMAIKDIAVLATVVGGVVEYRA